MGLQIQIPRCVSLSGTVDSFEVLYLSYYVTMGITLPLAAKVIGFSPRTFDNKEKKTLLRSGSRNCSVHFTAKGATKCNSIKL